MDRYNRHNLIDWFDQAKVRDSRIVVVGAGAVGNEVLKNLALLGSGHISIYDFDRIEEHNLTRCVLFRDSDIGRFKADVAAETCRLIDPNTACSAHCVDFWKGLRLGDVEDADAVVCCVDNYEARIRLNQLCMMTGTDFYNTGIDSRYSCVELFPFASEPDCACYECGLPASVYDTIQKRYSCGWLRKVAYEEKKIPTTAITSSVAGAVAVSIMLNRLNTHAHALEGAVRYFHDTISLQSTVSVTQRKDDCAACHRYDPCGERFSAKRECSHHALLPLTEGADVEVLLSEPILLRGKCSLCQREQEYFESARELTDAVTFCGVCGRHSVVAEFAERMSLADFESIFAGRNLPCKFLTYHAGNRQVVVELED